ncbi:CPBP family intramembrane metalloprotease [bacterium]|nr:CPBP family intramembrane metalloprotease [bacterium]
MNWNKVNIVYLKEIKDTLRDKRTVMMMILVPILLYPLLFMIMGQLMTAGTKKLEAQKSRIALNDSLPGVLIDMIRENKDFDIQSVDNPVESLKAKEIQGFLTKKIINDTLQYVVYYDGALDKSRLCEDRLTGILNRYLRQEQEQLLLHNKVDTSVLEPFEIHSKNIAPPSRMGGMLLGSMIPLILIVTMVLGAMYPAIDLTAGEKERGTLETILTIPIQRLELLFGKFLTVTTTAFITGLLNLASMILVYTSGMVQIGKLSELMEFGITPYGLLWLIVSLIPFALFISAAIISVCLFARSFKEAQNFVTPVYLLIMFPSFIAFMPGVELNRTLAMIPVVNISLLFREIFLNNYPLGLIAFTFLANSFVAMLFIIIVVKLFHVESVLFGENQPFQLSLKRSHIRPAPSFQPSSALLIFALVMLLLFYIGYFAQIKSIVWGLVITEWALICLPVILLIWFFKVNIKQTLNLKKANWTAFLGTVFTGIGALGVMVWVSRLQMEIFPEYQELVESMEKILNISTTPLHPAIGLFIFAFSPAICEEMLFRGLLLSSLKKHMPGWMVIVFVGFLFGVFHVHLYRIVPTALLGILFTYIVFRTGSIWPSILAHFINNSVVYLLVNSPTLVEKIPWLIGESWPTLKATLIMITLMIFGIALIEMRAKNQIMDDK